MPDLGIVTLNDMLDNASMIASLDRSIPLIADADTGYGGPIMVGRTVKSYIAAGIAGLHLEDQVQTKRCGHLTGKELVDEDVFYSRIRAAVLARDEMRRTCGGDIVLIARTDSLQSSGYDASIRRLKKAVEIGADVAFLEGPTSIEQCRQVCADLTPTPVLLNIVPGGVTPKVSAAKAKELGFQIVIHPGLALVSVLHSVNETFAELKSTGDVTVDEAKESAKGVFKVCGLTNCMEFDKMAGGTSFNNGM